MGREPVQFQVLWARKPAGGLRTGMQSLRLLPEYAALRLALRTLATRSVFLLLLSLCIPVVHAVAQSSPQQPAPFTQAQIAKIAEDLGLELNSRHLARLIDKQRSRTSGEEQPIYEDPGEDEPRGVVLHLRGRAGIPFPLPSEVLNSFTVSDEELNRSMEDFQGRIRKQVEVQTSPPKALPPCRAATTEREDFGVEFPGGPKQTMMDLVIVEKGKEPRDPDEVFGKGVMVVGYDTEEPDALSIGVAGLGITCLPSRLRVTARYRYRQEGVDALKNYSDDPDGRGKLHEFYREAENDGLLDEAPHKKKRKEKRS